MTAPATTRHTCGGPAFGRLTAGCPRCDELLGTRPVPPAPPKAAKHTCGGPVFGHKTPGCPRCDELLAGAAPIAQPWRVRQACQHCGDPVERGHSAPICRRCEIARHDCQLSRCGAVCTAFDW